jgi:hypothetical protein
MPAVVSRFAREARYRSEVVVGTAARRTGRMVGVARRETPTLLYLPFMGMSIPGLAGEPG